jgi:hypothetical protein
VPAAAVIPAPRAYMQVAAVEKLVVGSRVFGGCGPPKISLGAVSVLRALRGTSVPPVTLKNFECFRQASSGLKSLAWNHNCWDGGIAVGLLVILRKAGEG